MNTVPAPQNKVGSAARYAAVAAAVAVAALAVAAVLQLRPKPYQGPVESITVGNIGLFSNFNVIAKEKGYFLENGLNARVDEYDSGATASAALNAGTADVIVSSDFVGMRNMFQHPEWRIIAQVSSHNVFRVIARRDSGITDPANLAGKKVAVTKGTAGEFYLSRFLAANGLAASEITLSDAGPDAMKAGLADGTFDAIVIFEPHAYRLEQEHGDTVVSWSAQSGRRTLALVYSTQRFIDEHPETVRRYLAAIVEAERFNDEHADEAADLVAASLKLDRAYLDYLKPRFDFTVTLDQNLPVTMEDLARWGLSSGIVSGEEAPNFLQHVYFEGLTTVKPHAVTLVH